MLFALVSMPWSVYNHPSAAVGSLLAYIREQEPSYEVRSFSEHVRVATTIGFDLYEVISENAYELGELLYLAQIYPALEPQIRQYFVESAPKMFFLERTQARQLADLGEGFGSFDDVFSHIRVSLARHLDELAQSLSTFNAVGLTTCFGQLFANIALCQRLKQISPGITTILGGSTVSSRVGPSLLAEYPCLDYIVQGEGERPLLALLRALKEGRSALSGGKGIVSREGGLPPEGAPLWEVEDLNALPPPDYDEYAARAAEAGIDWLLPIEGSRGCWWDRSKRTRNPKSTCYFCNLNIQWNGYREKSVARVVSELDELTERYSNTRVIFMDNIIRHKGVSELARGLSSLGKDLDIFYEMRASIRPREILAMWEAGLNRAQFGVEALSSSLLRRIGKGTRTIQNLEVMKICYELGIQSYANLIVDFPGSTEQEVQETCQNIRKYALGFHPCSISKFHLGVDATIDALPEEFGVSNIRNSDRLREGLPEDVWRRLSLFDLSYDVAEKVDWSPVEDECARWKARQQEVGEPLLVYYDGGTFLRLVDRRVEYEILFLRGALRKIYLFCMEIQPLGRIVEHLRGEADRGEVLDALGQLVERCLMFEEDGKYLSLATASSPQIAAQRIRRSARVEQVFVAREEINRSSMAGFQA